MRTTTAYFAGVGTVVAAVVAGLGGGLLMAKIVNPPKQFAETTRLEQRTSSKSIPVVNASSEPVSYLAATEPATSGPITVVPPAGKPQPSETVKAEAPPVQPPAASAPRSTAASVAQTAISQQTEQTKPSEDALIKARNADVARDTDARREAKRVEEKRKAERRQQWTERRRNPRRQDQELREVEQKVREATEPAAQPVQAFAAQPVTMESPRIRLFGDN
jgi:hypothetical protein